MNKNLRFLLLQVRNPGDPMAPHEHECFARAFNVELEQIVVHDLLHTTPSQEPLDSIDMVLFGGAGDYSVAKGGPWLESALSMMRELCELGKPTYASCWGFQAMALALGGEVINDRSRAEVGSHEVYVKEAGKQDPVFGGMPERFFAMMGHEDIVTKLPPDAVLLASSDRVENQAFKIEGKPIYCTQFHPELQKQDLISRLENYPHYVQEVCGISLEELVQNLAPSDDADKLLPRILSEIVNADS